MNTGRPWATFGVNFPLPDRKHGCLRAVYPFVTFVDQFSKYTEAAPIPNTSAEVCARAYASHIFARHGAGSILVTDQDTSFS
jgi:hypothetical protein